MRDTLGVAVNREGLHTLEVDERFEPDGPFAIELSNYGESTHVHVNLDDDLSEIARIDATNHYVESEETRTVRVHVRDPGEWPSDTVRGKLKVVVGHGREKRFVDVVFDRTTEKPPVDVDPELSTPGAGNDGGGGVTLRLLPVVVLGLVAIMLAAGALVAADGINFVLGAFAVLAAALSAVAAYYLV